MLEKPMPATLHKPKTRGGDATMELGALASVEIRGSLNRRGQVEVFTHTEKVGTITTIGHKGRVVLRGFRVTGLCRII